MAAGLPPIAAAPAPVLRVDGGDVPAADDDSFERALGLAAAQAQTAPVVSMPVAASVEVPAEGDAPKLADEEAHPQAAVPGGLARSGERGGDTPHAGVPALPPLRVAVPADAAFAGAGRTKATRPVPPAWAHGLPDAVAQRAQAVLQAVRAAVAPPPRPEVVNAPQRPAAPSVAPALPRPPAVALPPVAPSAEPAAAQVPQPGVVPVPPVAPPPGAVVQVVAMTSSSPRPAAPPRSSAASPHWPVRPTAETAATPAPAVPAPSGEAAPAAPADAARPAPPLVAPFSATVPGHASASDAGSTAARAVGTAGPRADDSPMPSPAVREPREAPVRPTSPVPRPMSASPARPLDSPLDPPVIADAAEAVAAPVARPPASVTEHEARGRHGSREPVAVSPEPVAGPLPTPAAATAAAATAAPVREGHAPVAVPESSPTPAGPAQEASFEPARRAADRITLRFEGEQGLDGRVRIAVRGERVHASILSGDAHTLERLTGGMPALQRALEEQGFTDTRVVVHDLRPAGASTETRSETRSGEDRRQGESSRRQQGGDEHGREAGPEGQRRERPSREGRRGR